MAQVKFYLHKRGTQVTNLPILAKYTFGKGQRFEYYTGLRANVSWYINEYYTKASGKPIRNNAPNASYLNDELEVIKGNILTIERNAKANNIPLSIEYFRAELDKLQKPEKVVEAVEEEKPVTFMIFLDTYIERCKIATNKKTGQRLSNASQVKFTTIKNLLIEFNTIRKKEINFNGFDTGLYNELVNFMIDKKKYSINTYGSVIKYIKTLLFAATEQGYNTNIKFMKVFKGATEETESIYLTETELESMYKIDLSDNKRLDTVRDLFLVGCWTGLRFGDFTSIKREDVSGDRIRLKNHKTVNPVIIPIHPIVRAILEKYNYELPAAISNQKFNKFIKEVAAAAEINNSFNKHITKGGERLSKTMSKHQAVTTHSARRSFATNAYKRGIETLLIMAITGHKTEREFFKYIRVTGDEKADMFASQAKW